MSSMEVGQLQHGISGIKKMCENENIKIDMLMNPNDVLDPINHVFDDFG